MLAEPLSEGQSLRQSLRTLRATWLGCVPHAQAWALQESLRCEVLAEPEAIGRVLLCTHPAVITLGRSASSANVLASVAQLRELNIDVVQTDRGGDVTYHDEGQLMIYPVVRLRRGVVELLEAVAAAIIDVASELGVTGARFERTPAGVWLGDAKLAACGIHLRRGVVGHGYAFNVNTDPARWQLIRPCGLASPVISLATACHERGLPPPPSLAVIAERLAPTLLTLLR